MNKERYRKWAKDEVIKFNIDKYIYIFIDINIDSWYSFMIF